MLQMFFFFSSNVQLSQVGYTATALPNILEFIKTDEWLVLYISNCVGGDKIVYVAKSVNASFMAVINNIHYNVSCFILLCEMKTEKGYRWMRGEKTAYHMTCKPDCL